MAKEKTNLKGSKKLQTDLNGPEERSDLNDTQNNLNDDLNDLEDDKNVINPFIAGFSSSIIIHLNLFIRMCKW